MSGNLHSASGSTGVSGALKEFKKEDIEGANSRERCLIVLHGFVYDVTIFLDKHPGEGCKALCGPPPLKIAQRLLSTPPGGAHVLFEHGGKTDKSPSQVFDGKLQPDKPPSLPCA